MLDPVVCSFSNRATCNPADGHYYWMYKSLFDYQNQRGSSAGITFAPAGQLERHLQGILRAGSLGNEFRVSPLSVARYPWRRINSAIENLLRTGLTHIQFYDGGLMELLVATELARRHSSVQFVYNFHWAEDWVGLLSARKNIARGLTQAIRDLIKALPPNLTLSAETKTLANFVAENLGGTIDVYPIASTISPKKPKKWADRDVDVLFLPQRASEIPDVVRLAAMLSNSGLTPRIVAKNNIVGQLGRELPEGSVLVGPLNEDRYVDVLTSSRVVVLPYDKAYFEWGSSGKFNEAIACGAFPFAPHWTAIPSQSSGQPDNHRLTFEDLHQASRQIKQRLEQGFPTDLKAIFFEDFFEWLPTSTEVTGEKTASGSTGSVIWLLAFLYRSPSRTYRARRALGHLFDTLLKRVAPRLSIVWRVPRQRAEESELYGDHYSTPGGAGKSALRLRYGRDAGKKAGHRTGG